MVAGFFRSPWKWGALVGSPDSPRARDEGRAGGGRPGCLELSEGEQTGIQASAGCVAPEAPWVLAEAGVDGDVPVAGVAAPHPWSPRPLPLPSAPTPVARLFPQGPVGAGARPEQITQVYCVPNDLTAQRRNLLSHMVPGECLLPWPRDPSWVTPQPFPLSLGPSKVLREWGLPGPHAGSWRESVYLPHPRDRVPRE